MPAVAKRPDTDIDTAEDWPIETDYLRMKVSRQPDNGLYRCARPERRVARREWAGMWRADSPWADLTAREVLRLADDLHAEAARRYQLGRQQRAVQKREDLDRARRRRQARQQLRKRMGERFGHLRDAHRDEKPMQYSGGPDGGSEPMGFLEWLPSQLDAEQSKELAGMKREVKEAYDLPPHVQLM